MLGKSQPTQQLKRRYQKLIYCFFGSIVTMLFGVYNIELAIRKVQLGPPESTNVEGG